MRLTIATSKSCISLGINGAMSFCKAMYDNDLAAIPQRIVVTIDADFVENLQRMETYPFGFMEASKIELLKMCTDELGKKCIITREFISKSNEARAHYHMNAVKLINRNGEPSQQRTVKPSFDEKSNTPFRNHFADDGPF